MINERLNERPAASGKRYVLLWRTYWVQKGDCPIMMVLGSDHVLTRLKRRNLIASQLVTHTLCHMVHVVILCSTEYEDRSTLDIQCQHRTRLSRLFGNPG